MTARYNRDCCPACGSDDVIPYAVIVGASEEYGYQCLTCQVTPGPSCHAQARHDTARPASRARQGRDDRPGAGPGPRPDRRPHGDRGEHPDPRRTNCSTAPPATTTTTGSAPPWPPGDASARSGCAAPSATSTPQPARSSHALDTDDNPDKVIYLPCGDRRASVCPPCAETYRADTYQLIRAGLAGGKGVPESVAIHPCVFATFTAPSFGPVHTRVVTPGGKVARCRPRRKANYCPHGRRISCGQRHKEDDACLGRPLCPDCYDYNAAVVWNAHAAELWRRTVITMRRQPRQARQSPRRPGPAVLRQGRRVPAPRPDPLPRHLPPRRHRPRPPRAHRPAAPGDHRRRAGRSHPPGRRLGLVRHRLASGQAEAAGTSPGAPRSTPASSGSPTTARSPTSRSRPTWPSTPPSPPSRSASRPAGSPLRTPASTPTTRTHQGRLIAACLKLGSHPHEDFKALRRWAHMLGYRGHFATKSRRYSTTMRALRAARRDWQRRQNPLTRPTATRPSSRTRTSNGPDEAGAPTETPSSRCPPPHEPASIGASPVKKPKSPKVTGRM